jgi:hypothetical protein
MFEFLDAVASAHRAAPLPEWAQRADTHWTLRIEGAADWRIRRSEASRGTLRKSAENAFAAAAKRL